MHNITKRIANISSDLDNSLILLKSKSNSENKIFGGLNNEFEVEPQNLKIFFQRRIVLIFKNLLQFFLKNIR